MLCKHLYERIPGKIFTRRCGKSGAYPCGVWCEGKGICFRGPFEPAEPKAEPKVEPPVEKIEPKVEPKIEPVVAPVVAPKEERRGRKKKK